MRITKLGHCCLLVELCGKRILTDPGTYSTAQHEAADIDIVVITHEHADHFHIESLKTVLAHNKKAEVITNSAVGAYLTAEGIPFTLVEHGKEVMVGSLRVEGFGELHDAVHSSVSQVQNTGYFLGDKLFYPGDALYDPRAADPQRIIDVLALPVAGPWIKLSDAIEYALKLKPVACFPVHDGMLVPSRIGPVHSLTEKVLGEAGIKFKPATEGQVIDID